MASDEKIKFRFIPEMRRMDGAIRQLDRRFNRLKRKSDGIGAGLVKGLAGIGGAYAVRESFRGMTSSIEKNIDVQAVFRGAMAKLASETSEIGASAKETTMLWDLLSRTAGRSRFTMLETAMAMEELAKAGKTADEVMNILPTGINLSAATGFALNDTMQMLMTTMGGFSIKADQSAKVASQLAWAVNNSMTDMETMRETMKQMAGPGSGFDYVFENALAAAMTLGDVGIQGSMAGAALKNMFSFLRGSKTGEAADAVERIMTAMDETGMKRTFPNMMKAIAEATKNMGKQERAKFFSDFFGLRALPSALQLTKLDNLMKLFERGASLKGIKAEYVELLREMSRAGGVGIWKDLKSSIDALFVEFGSALITTFGPALLKLTEGVSRLKNFIRDNQGIAAWAAVVATVVAGLGVAAAAVSALVVGLKAVGLGSGLVAAAAGLGKVMAVAKTAGVLGGSALAGAGLGHWLNKKFVEPFLFPEEAAMEARGGDGALAAARAALPRGAGQGVLNYNHKIAVTDERTSVMLDQRHKFQSDPWPGFNLGSAQELGQ